MFAPLPEPFIDWPRPFAFAFSGGGAFGPGQVGMLRALAERDIRPDLIVGSSVGALHGSALASNGYDSLPQLEELWLTMDRRTLFGGKTSTVRSLLRSRTLSDAKALTRLITDQLSVPTFEDLEIPFAAVATDALTGEPQLLSSGPMLPALLASCAIPGVFPPVAVDGHLYVDGGVAANVPIRQAIAFGAQSILSLDVTPPSMSTAVPTTLVATLIHSTSLMLRNQRSHAIDDVAHRYRVATLPSATPPDMGTFNFSRTRDLLDDAYREAKVALESWRQDSLSDPLR